MQRFIARHAEAILGVVSGFDRLVFRGTLRRIAFSEGLAKFLNWQGIRLKDFKTFAETVTAQVKGACEGEAKRLKRPIVYLASSRTDKERVALEIAERDGISSGLVAVITCVEPCLSFDVYRNRDAKRLELVSRVRKCLHIYHYWLDARFGLMNLRIQTWLPLNVQVCLNGREWLARELDRRGVGYERRDNCFTWLEHVAAGDKLLRRQVRIDWVAVLDRLVRRLNPAHSRLFRDASLDYYWSVYQSEWATDIMFRTAARLQAIYRPLVLHGITSFASADVMRFLGRRVRSDFSGEVVSSFKDRAEGTRVKHSVGQNSVKVYDKQGSVLRVETTINEPQDLRVFRPKEGDRNGPRAWRQMRKGVADLPRRTQLSQACNERYLDALAAVDTAAPFGKVIIPLTRPVTWRGRRFRGLHPFSELDSSLLNAVARGNFHLKGFRNRDLQPLLYPRTAVDDAERRRRSARVSRLIRLLRAHGLIRKMSSSHRYVLTRTGHDLIPILATLQNTSLQQLQGLAA